jgi:hypothetical protein
MKFELSKEQIEKVEQWDDLKMGHKCSLQSNEFSDKYVGCAGGHLSYIFTPTGLGDIVEVKCSCGETLNITEYEHW